MWRHESESPRSFRGSSVDLGLDYDHYGCLIDKFNREKQKESSGINSQILVVVWEVGIFGILVLSFVIAPKRWRKMLYTITVFMSRLKYVNEPLCRFSRKEWERINSFLHYT